ncbi:MAG: TadE/TadG family type IV pilus assembly protein [Maioricimonas sp. JB049]
MQILRRRNDSRTRPASRGRFGATLVETAVVMPVFAIFIAGIMEFGHAYLVINTLNAAAKRAARHGAVEEISTSDVVDKAHSILAAAMKTTEAHVYVKDASVFDSPGVDPDRISYSSLPDIELLDADDRQLYVVRIEVDYGDVALMPPFWAKNIRLSGQSVMRHE